MNARDLIERGMPAAPTEAPPKPGVKPGAPPAPARPSPRKHPNPFIRPRQPGVEPGPMPKPKACSEGIRDWLRGKADLAKEIVSPGQSASYRKFRAKELIGADPVRKGLHFNKPSGPEAANTGRAKPGMAEALFNRDRAIKFGRAKPLADTELAKDTCPKCHNSFSGPKCPNCGLTSKKAARTVAAAGKPRPRTEAVGNESEVKCPDCGSTAVTHREPGTAGTGARYTCNACKCAWKAQIPPPKNEAVGDKIPEDPKADLWRCPACGKLNCWNWDDAEKAQAKYGEDVAVATGSAFDNICGHCRRDFVRRDSPIRAEVYTHEPHDPGERKRSRLAALSNRRGRTGLGSYTESLQEGRGSPAKAEALVDRLLNDVSEAAEGGPAKRAGSALTLFSR